MDLAKRKQLEEEAKALEEMLANPEPDFDDEDTIGGIESDLVAIYRQLGRPGY